MPALTQTCANYGTRLNAMLKRQPLSQKLRARLYPAEHLRTCVSLAFDQLSFR